MKCPMILILLLQIVSCDFYKSKVPITNSDSSTINTSWIGRWVVLDGTELRYPIIEIHLQPFNEREYVATVTFYKNTGRSISSVETFKVHNSKLINNEFLNVKNVDIENKNHLFYKIEEDLTDSIYIRYLMDTLKIEFETSIELKNYLTKEQSKLEEVLLSYPITLLRWKSLTWDRINKRNRSAEFDAFYLLGKIDEDYFIQLPEEALEQAFNKKQEIKIDKIRDYFKEVQLVTQGNNLWKVPTYGLIKMKSGEYIKLKLDLIGPLIKDLTNDISYINRNTEKWKF